MEIDASKERKQELFMADMKLFNECQVVAAVLINNDPGTLIEIGLAVGLGKPAIVYDPDNIATNLMLTEVPKLVTSSLDEVISKVFEIGSRII